MNVYITYDRYEHDEWLSVYHIETNRQRAIKHFKEEDLVSFISYGPDDCHSFQLQKVVLSKEQYKRLVWLVENEGKCGAETDQELHDLLVEFYDDNSEYEPETIMSTDGCSDNTEIIRFYCQMENLDPEDDDHYEMAQEVIMNDEDIYLRVLKEYISCYY